MDTINETKEKIKKTAVKAYTVSYFVARFSIQLTVSSLIRHNLPDAKNKWVKYATSLASPIIAEVITDYICAHGLQTPEEFEKWWDENVKININETEDVTEEQEEQKEESTDA